MAGDAIAPSRQLNEQANDAADEVVTPGHPPLEPVTGDALGAAVADVEDDGREVGDQDTDDEDTEATAGGRTRRVRLAMLVGLTVVVPLAGLVGWLGYHAKTSHNDEVQRNMFVQAARQGALNLTTIDWQHADSDVQRILDGATGTFFADFSKRSQPFVDVVKRAESKSVGTITEAGLESATPTDAQVLVAVAVKTSTGGTPERDSRSWRMRISVQMAGTQTKVSNVEFVP